MTKDQEIARLRDLLSYVTSETRCMTTRKFIAKGLRDLDDAIAGRQPKLPTVENGKAANRV